MTLGKFVVGLILLIVGIVFAIESKRAPAYDSELPEREKNIQTILKENKKTIYGVLSAFFIIPSAILIILSVMMFRKRQRSHKKHTSPDDHSRRVHSHARLDKDNRPWTTRAERSRTRNVPLQSQRTNYGLYRIPEDKSLEHV